MFTPEIIFEDNQILVSLKPPGILSQPSSLEVSDMLTALKEYLKIRHDKPGNVFLGLVHRLDLNVGGVMVFAKTSSSCAAFRFDSQQGIQEDLSCRRRRWLTSDRAGNLSIILKRCQSDEKLWSLKTVASWLLYHIDPSW